MTSSFYSQHIKRILDLVLAVFALVLASPAMLFIAMLVRLKLGKPVLFRQSRLGYHMRPFSIYKFRTMTDTRDEKGNLVPDAERLTKLGRLLRSSSLDELPELINVLRGQMSLVGPRPLLIQYLERYSLEQLRRHDVLPGITGWAQINGRNALTWEKTFALDTWYVDHHNLFLDLKIIAVTIWKVLSREGVNQTGHATRSEFQGTTGE